MHRIVNAVIHRNPLRLIKISLIIFICLLFTNVYSQGNGELFEVQEIAITAVQNISQQGVLNNIDRQIGNAIILRNRYLKTSFWNIVEDNNPDSPKELLILNLFPDLVIPATSESIERRGEFQFTWKGKVEGIQNTQVVIVVDHDEIAANIWILDRLIQIRPIGDGIHTINEINQSAFPPELAPQAVDLPGEDGAKSKSVPQSEKSATVTPYIDMMIVYTADAAAASSNIEQEIQLGVDELNVIYKNSGILQRARLVHTEQINYNESGSLSTDRNRLQNPSDGFMDDVHSLRDTYGADLVSLWVADGGGGCGIAYIMTTVGPGAESIGFNVCALGCATGNLTFAHELGHNMSARHDRHVDPTQNSPYGYNHGYTNVNESWRTVMAYNNACSDAGGSCHRLPYFSNPDTTHPFTGSAMGIPGGDPVGADNRQTLNNTAATVEAFRTLGTFLSATPAAANASSVAQSVSIDISNIGSGTMNWSASVTSGNSWLSITSGSSGSGNGTIELSLDENSASGDRGGVVEITSPEAVNSPVEVLITQFGAQAYATLPYQTGFESGSLDEFWRVVNSAPVGQVQVSTANGPHSGNFHLTMDVSASGEYVVNEAWLCLDLSGTAEAELDFWWKDVGDETHVKDAVYFSDDGGATFQTVHQFWSHAFDGWTNFVLDIDELAGASGLALTDKFIIKFSHMDNFPLTSDGFAFDDISVSGTGAQNIDLEMAIGWNMIGRPLDVADSSVTALYPSAEASSLFGWDGTYSPETEIAACRGYWLRYLAETTETIAGTPRNSCSIELVEGWNMIAGPSCSVPVTSIGDPDGVIITGTIFGWSGTYFGASTIEQGKGYWVRANNGGTITLACAENISKLQRVEAIDDLSRESALMIKDANGASQKLYFNVPIQNEAQKLRYSMPPIPPAQLFDARFEDGYRAIGEVEGIISLQTRHFPVRITTSNLIVKGDAKYLLQEVIGVEIITSHVLKDGEEVVITNPAVRKLQLRLLEGTAPTTFAVAQNFPNPFNPTTEIQYAIPQPENVTLEIYNSVGQKVRTLVSQQQEAGIYTVTWNATNDAGKRVGSGVYFYHVTAGSQQSIKKMLLIK